jgi:hypothetical protein
VICQITDANTVVEPGGGVPAINLPVDGVLDVAQGISPFQRVPEPLLDLPSTDKPRHALAETVRPVRHC